jgi:hypothetical protein
MLVSRGCVVQYRFLAEGSLFEYNNRLGCIHCYTWYNNLYENVSGVTELC